MKKINNNGRFRGNAVYSLNYKFDSVSPAGKCSGTALDLIKRYNELAKEAQNNGDYVEMEVFRQYAEHYRKIVTEINERKYQTRENQNNTPSNGENSENTETAPIDNGLVETQSAEPVASANVEKPNETAETPKLRRRRNFTVIDVSPMQAATETAAEENTAPAETAGKSHRRRCSRKTVAADDAAQEA